MNTLRTLGKWIGGSLLALIVLVLAGYFMVSHNINQRIQKHYRFTAENLTIPNDKATLQRGEHLATIKGCTDCHGKNLAGKIFMNDGAIGRLVAANLTHGKGGRPADYSTSDWLMALRHGVDRRGRPLLFMPSHESTVLAEPDLQALIAYCQQVPAVDNELPGHDVGPVAKVMTYLGKMPLLPVEMIDHQKLMVARADTTLGIGQGKYLSITCTGCHKPDLKGGDPIAPGFPPTPNLTRTGATGRWTLAQFVNTLRTGKTPGGHQINNDHMPWKMTAAYSDKELASLYQYFRSLQ